MSAPRPRSPLRGRTRTVEETPRFVADIYPHPAVPRAAYVALAAALQAFIDEACRSTLQGYVWQREPLRVAVEAGGNGGSSSSSSGSGSGSGSGSSNGRAGPRSTAYDTSASLPRVVASMRHGGSVEDEWLAVHLLLLASQAQQFSSTTLLGAAASQHAAASTSSMASLPGFVMSICDEDGQFVLIEAADALPSWIQPSNAEGRVWIVEGTFHIIPPEMQRGDDDEAPSADHAAFNDEGPVKLSTALAMMYRDPSTLRKTVAPEAMMRAIIDQRLPTYPSLEWALDTQHTTLIYLPSKAARLLHKHPQLVADAAEAFQGRDGPMDARRLRDMPVFGPSNDSKHAHPSQGNDSPQASPQPRELLVRLRFPRRLYAILLAEKYFPSKAFGQHWRDAVAQFWQAIETEARQLSGGNKEREEGDKGGKEDGSSGSKQEARDRGRRRDLGCKITCGLELVFASVKERQRNNPRSMFQGNAAGGPSEDLTSKPRYAGFIKSLARMGFFGDTIRDSQAWKQREAEAVALWKQANEDGVTGEGEASGTSSDRTSDRLSFILKSVDQIDQEAAELPPHLDPSSGHHALSLEEDPDSFLYDTLTNMQDENTVGGKTAPNDLDDDDDTRAENAAMEQINAFSSKLQGFVEGQGDADGALFDDDEAMKGADSDEEERIDEEQTAARQQVASLSSDERQQAMRGLIPGVDATEWGAKDADSVRRARGEASRLEAKGEASSKETLNASGPAVEDIQSEGVRQGASMTRPRPEGAASGFSRHVRYEGASDSEESEDDEVLQAGDTDEDRFNRARFLGMEREHAEDMEMRRQTREDGGLASRGGRTDTGEDADDHDDDDDEGSEAIDEDGVRMGPKDLRSFLEFARKELGLSQEQYDTLLDQRRERGAYVPDFTKKRTKATHGDASRRDGQGKNVSFSDTVQVASGADVATNARMNLDMGTDEDGDGDGDDDIPEGDESFPGVDEYGAKKGPSLAEQKRETKSKALSNDRTSATEKEEARSRAAAYLERVEKDATAAAAQKQATKSASREKAPSDPFAQLMNAMDNELVKLKGGKGIAGSGSVSDAASAPSNNDVHAAAAAPATFVPPSDPDVDDDDDEDSDEDMQDLSAQDAELLEKMLHSGPPASLQALLERDDPNHPLGLSATERQVMHGMLESYKAQHGGAGPVSSLAGRFGVGRLPDDADAIPPPPSRKAAGGEGR